MIRSASFARWCIPVTKHGLNDGHFCPVQVSRRASRRPHNSESSGKNVSSVRSPVSVSLDRKSTRLNSSHGYISYAVFCLKKKNNAQALTCDSRVDWSIRLSHQMSELAGINRTAVTRRLILFCCVKMWVLL